MTDPEIFPPKMGRPSEFSPEVVDAICERMVQGKGLLQICNDDAMPARTTIYRWLESNSDFRTRFNRAREGLMDYYAEQILQIAFDESGDIILEQAGDKSKAVANHAKVQRDRLKVDSLKWIASRLFPRRYGDKMEVLAENPDSAGGNQLEVNWGPSARVIVYPMLGADGRLLTIGAPEYNAAIEQAAREAKARGQREATVGTPLDRDEHEPAYVAPPQITYQPEPMPDSMSPEDRALMFEVLTLIRRTIPSDDSSPPGMIFRVIREALLLHFREIEIDQTAMG
jgi:hypothetical protein